jgi:hypothetical protein
LTDDKQLFFFKLHSMHFFIRSYKESLDRILNRITGVTSGCWWLVVVNAIPISDICQINQQNISSCSVINNRIKKIS